MEYMSGWFFITPYDPEDWQQQNIGDVPEIFAVDIHQFGAALKRQWSEAEIQEATSDSPIAIYWNLLPMDTVKGLDGNLHSDLQTLTFKIGVDDDLIPFIVWYRQFIPDRYKLYLFHHNSFERLELTLATGEDRIRQFVARSRARQKS